MRMRHQLLNTESIAAHSDGTPSTVHKIQVTWVLIEATKVRTVLLTITLKYVLSASWCGASGPGEF